MSARAAAEALVLACIAAVAPDADLAALDPAADLRDALDLDSMDVLRIVDAVEERAGVVIPERAYPRLQTLTGFVDEVAARLA